MITDVGNFFIFGFDGTSSLLIPAASSTAALRFFGSDDATRFA